MEGIDYWRLCDDFSITQAAMLIAGQDPSHDQYYVEGWEPHKRPVGYEAAKAALVNSVVQGKINANIVY